MSSDSTKREREREREQNHISRTRWESHGILFVTEQLDEYSEWEEI